MKIVDLGLSLCEKCEKTQANLSLFTLPASIQQSNPIRWGLTATQQVRLDFSVENRLLQPFYGKYISTSQISVRIWLCTCGTGRRRRAQPAEERWRMTPSQQRTQPCHCQSLRNGSRIISQRDEGKQKHAFSLGFPTWWCTRCKGTAVFWLTSGLDCLLRHSRWKDDLRAWKRGRGRKEERK